MIYDAGPVGGKAGRNLGYTPDEVARLRDVPGSLVAQIEAEGHVLYAHA